MTISHVNSLLNNTEMNLKSTTINGFDFGIINSLKAFWRGGGGGTLDLA